MNRLGVFAASVFLASFAACAGGGEDGFGDSGMNFPDGNVLVPDGSSVTDGGTIPTGPAQVFGHSGDTLYKVDPNTKAVTTIGTLAGCDGSVLDLAIDKDSNAIAVTAAAMYKVNLSTGDCTLVGTNGAPYPTSLTFVPAGTRDANKEALVGYGGGGGTNDATYYIQYDPATGDEVWRSPNPVLPDGLISSGDIVSIINGPSYLTVKGSYDNGTKTIYCGIKKPGGTEAEGDCMVKIDPTTGKQAAGSTVMTLPKPYAQVFGIAFWAGTVYGFDKAGELFSIKFPASGTSLAVTPISIPNAPAGLSFYGAGSTTAAPPDDR